LRRGCTPSPLLCTARPAQGGGGDAQFAQGTALASAIAGRAGAGQALLIELDGPLRPAQDGAALAGQVGERPRGRVAIIITFADDRSKGWSALRTGCSRNAGPVRCFRACSKSVEFL
jgi:hypothetical protein